MFTHVGYIYIWFFLWCLLVLVSNMAKQNLARAFAAAETAAENVNGAGASSGLSVSEYQQYLERSTSMTKSLNFRAGS